MNDRKIEESIKRVVDQAPLDLLDRIKAQPVSKMLRHDEITAQKKKGSRVKKIIPLAAAAAVFMIFGTWQYQFRSPDSEIYMDINPSIALVTNRRNEVIDIQAGNDDGKNLIESLSYKGEDYLAVTEEILDLMILNGYLDETEGMMLLSVHNQNGNKESSQLTELDVFIHDYLTQRGIDPVILGQKIDKTSTITEYAKEYGVSESKMTFIRNLMILHPDLTIEELVPMSLQDLVYLSRQLGLDLGNIIESRDLEKIHDDPEIENPDHVDDDDDVDDDDNGHDDDEEDEHDDEEDDDEEDEHDEDEKEDDEEDD